MHCWLATLFSWLRKRKRKCAKAEFEPVMVNLHHRTPPPPAAAAAAAGATAACVVLCQAAARPPPGSWGDAALEQALPVTGDRRSAEAVTDTEK